MRADRFKKKPKDLDSFVNEVGTDTKFPAGIGQSFDALQIPRDNESAKKFAAELETVIEEFNKKIDDDEMDLSKYVLKNKIMLLEKTKKIIDEYLKAQLDICTPRGFEVLGTLLKISGDLVANIERGIPVKTETLPAPIDNSKLPAGMGTTNNVIIVSNRELLDTLVEKNFNMSKDGMKREDGFSSDRIIDVTPNPK